MKTIIQRMQDKADVIARRFKEDVDFICVYTANDKEYDANYGMICVEFNEHGGPKWKHGRIVGDHDCTAAIYVMEEFVKTIGAKLELFSEGDDIEHHRIFGYRVIFDDTIRGK